ncbi:MAG: tetratricopeptide repeat protein [Bryobacterales bacterium]|nr:tetratricopeptide repeat protein [Bryobacterales bacterium]
MKKNKTDRSVSPVPNAPTPERESAAYRSGWLVWSGLFCLAVVLAWVAYAPAINGGYVFDDITLTFRSDPNFAARGATDVLRGVRPLVELSHWVVYQLTGGRPFLHHLISVLIHAASSVLLGYILLRLLTLAGTVSRSTPWIAALGAGIFLLHPANSEAVAYITSRSEVLSVFFYLAALAVFLGRDELLISWRRAIAVLGLFVLALLSKEHSLTLPIALVMLDLWIYRQSLAGLLRNGWRVYGLMVAGAAMGALLVAKVLQGAVTAGFGMKDLTWWEYLLTQGRAIVLYLRLFLLPVGQNGDYLFPISRSPLEYGAIFYWAALIAAAIAAIVYRKRAPLVSLGFLLFLVLLMPTSSVLPIQDAAVERRVYLSSIGLLIATAGLLRRIDLPLSTLRYAGLALLLVLTIGTFQRSEVWASHDAFWNDVLAKNPDSWRANVQVGLTALEGGRCQEALERFEKALPRAAANFAAALHMNYARALDCAGRPAEAEKEFRASLAIENQAATWTQLGVFYARAERSPEALDAFNQAVTLNPGFPLAYSNRGNLHARLGDCARAVPDFEKALQLMPSNTTAQRGLAYCRERERR